LTTPPPRPGRRRARPWVPDALGIGWVLVVAVSALSPALVHGASFYSPFGGDQLDFFIPSTHLTWTEVHQGHLPLWNPYSALGMPLAFNWQSAAFSIPALVSYLVPLHLAFLTQMLVTLAIAGSGVYVLGRVLGLGILGCAMAATVYELSTTFMGWLGWPVAGVMSWAGWLFAAAILVVRGQRRSRAMACFAVVLALVIYAGHPETVVLLGAALVVFVVVFLVGRRWLLGAAGHVLRPGVDLVMAAVIGVALAAPLVLPGVQVILGSINNVRGLAGINRQAIPFHDFMGYVRAFGVIGVALIITAVALRWKRPAVIAFLAAALVMGLLAFSAPVESVMNRLPFLGNVHWEWATVAMIFALALPAGVGLDLLVRSHRDRRVRLWTAASFVAACVVILTLFAAGRVLWPVAQVVLGLTVVGILSASPRRLQRLGAARKGLERHLGRWAGLALLACESAFLAAAVAPLWMSAPIPLSPPPSGGFAWALKQDVGTAVLGLGTRNCFPKSPGITQNENLTYGLQEFAVYDPVVPHAYFQSWTAATGAPAGPPTSPLIFCPAVTSATLARRYGVGFVIEPAGFRGPSGAVFVKNIKFRNVDLYRIPGAAPATLSALDAGGRLPGPDAPGTAVAVTHPGPASWKLMTDAPGPRVLRLRLTDVPGWHASIDGHALALSRFAGVMLQARVPPGRHRVELHYWPDTFNVGLAVAGLGVLALAVPVVAGARRRRRATARRA
jgi:hypothetical protein